MKSILVTAYHGWVFRNVIGSAALKRVHESTGAQIYLCVPPDKEEFARATYGEDWLQVIPFDTSPIISSRWNKFWYRLGFLIENSQYVRDQRLERCVRVGGSFAYINYLFLNTFAAIVSKLSLSPKLYQYFDGVCSPADCLDVVYNQYKPDLIFATDIFSESDVLFLRNAKRRAIRTIGMVRSWDNTTTKGILRCVPDQVLVNSITAQRELHDWHGVRRSDVTIVGAPQFDSWIQGATVTREEFARSLGIDASRRIVILAPAGSILSDTDWQVCKLLQDAISVGRLPDDIVILVSNHPQHPADLSAFVPDEHFLVERLGTRTIASDYKGATLAPHEHDKLRNMVYYSELVMYVASSLGLDATVFDKPQIIVSFDGWETRPLIRSVRRYNREDCLARMVESGGTSVAHSIDELVEYMNMYLRNPSTHHEGRMRAIHDHLYRLDGQASERIAQAITKACSNGEVA